MTPEFPCDTEYAGVVPMPGTTTTIAAAAATVAAPVSTTRRRVQRATSWAESLGVAASTCVRSRDRRAVSKESS